MSFLKALYDSYDYGLKNNLICNLDDKKSLILPIFHNSMKSDGKNIVEITLNKNSEILYARFLEKDDVIIFPVTEDSVARSSGIAPHPLSDTFDYIIQDGSKKSEAYMKQLESWLAFDNDEFVKIIYNYIIKENVFKSILDNLYAEYRIIKDKKIEYTEETEKKYKNLEKDFSKIFLTYRIKDYEGVKDVSLTENKDLQTRFIKYTKEVYGKDKNSVKIICNISGKEDYLCTKHRSLIANAKLISQITANDENFKGRFDQPYETIKIGKESSQKIMLMAKALLDGDRTSRWLSEMCYVVSWFSDDIQNKIGLNPAESILLKLSENIPLMKMFKDDLDEDNSKTKEKISSKITEEIVKSFTSAKILFKDSSSYYMAIIDKVSNGRVAVKYFREIKGSRLKENLKNWQRRYHWFIFNKNKELLEFTPSPIEIINASYGIEKKGFLEVSKKAFLQDQYSNIMAAIVEGRQMPRNIIRALEINIRKRMNYDDTWEYMKLRALAVLREKEGIDSDMLDRKNTDRSYLFGRLLALYERLEAATYDSDTKRITNAEKLWTSYVNKPVTMNARLRNLMMPYIKKLKASENKIGLYYKIEKDIREVTNLLDDNYDYRSIEVNRPLNSGFIFGYEAEKRFLFEKKENIESEDK